MDMDPHTLIFGWVQVITYRLGKWNFGQAGITYIDFNIKLQCCKCLRAALHSSSLVSVSELSKSNQM